MSSHPIQKYISVAGISFLTAGNAVYTCAQDSSSDTSKDELLEEVVVEGYRGSLQNAVDAKRSAEGITDSIFSEDIGKSSDQNIADALQRVTGVSIQREDGEGTSITVRGAGPDLNNIKLNGITLTSGSENQTVDLSSFSADILSKVEVQKTASADQDEGSLGATVKLNTFKPLNVKKEKRVLEVQQRFNDLSNEKDRKFSGSYSQKFMDDTLGIATTAFHETQTVRRDQFSVNRYISVKTARARDSVTGEVLSSLPNYKDSNITDDGVRGLARDQSGYQLWTNTRERKGLTASVQFAPTYATDIQFNITASNQYVEIDNHSLTAFGKNNVNLPGDPVEDWYTFDQTTRTFTKRLDREGRGRTSRLQAGTETENRIYSFSATHQMDNLTFSLRGGISDTKSDDDYYNFINATNNAHVNSDVLEVVPSNVIQPVGHDCSSGQCVLVTGNHIVDFGADPLLTNDNIAFTGYNPDDINAIHLQQARTRDRLMEDRGESFYADVDWDVDFAGINRVEFGIKYENREKHVVNQFVQYENTGKGTIGLEGEVFPRGLSKIPLDEVGDGLIIPGDFLDGLGYAKDNNTDGWPTVNATRAMEVLFGSIGNGEVRFVKDKKQDRSVDLENKSAYLKLNFTYFTDRLYGNVGLRYIETDTNSGGVSGIKFSNSQPPLDTSAYWADVHDPSSPDYDPNLINLNGSQRKELYHDTSTLPNPEDFTVAGEHSYSMVLPSLTLNWLMSNDMIARFALSKTMARPRIDSLQPGFRISESLWSDNARAVINNPALEPLESTNLDLSWEWYFAQGSVLSAALFYKDMTNFEESESVSAYWRDLRQVDDLTGIKPSEIFLDSPDSAVCMPRRISVNDTGRYKNPDIGNPGGEDAGCNRINITTRRNGSGAESKGIELGYNQNYSFLPGIWSGLGTALNYTYSDTETDAEIGSLGNKLEAMPLARVPIHTANATVFWQRSGHLIRLSYNYRTDSLLNRSFNGGATWNEGQGRLDLSTTWKVNDHLALIFSGVNLTDTASRQYFTNLSNGGVEREGNALDGGVTKSRTLSEWHTGRMYRLSLRATY